MRHLSARRFAVIGSALAAATILGLGARVSGQAQAGAAAPVFLVALDRLGEPVTNLEPSQVSLTLDGARCPSVKVEPINWPMKLTVLLDNSVSMRNDLPSLRDGLKAFLAEVPDGVEVAIYVLAPQPRPLLRATTDRQAIAKASGLLAPDAGVAKLLDGLGEAVGRIVKEKGDAFYTMMVFTTNGSEGSNGNIDDTWKKLQAQIPLRPLTMHVLMYSLTGQAALRTSGIQISIGRAITQSTSGHYDNIGAASRITTLMPEFAKLIARAANLQSHQYRVTCEGSTAKDPAMSLSTSDPRVADVIVTRNGQIGAGK
ncbi:MAG: hypothetical protein WBD07_09955 [Vicinamibacterales bacterium]